MSVLQSEMISEIEEVSGLDISTTQSRYERFITAARTSVQQSEFSDFLMDLHEELNQSLVSSKIRAIDSWASGETSFNILPKSWESVIDKLYRVNILENSNRNAKNSFDKPTLHTLMDRAKEVQNPQRTWVSAENVHEYIDDLIRTKFVVPFLDGVVDLSERIYDKAKRLDLPTFWRHHAKDSGYHARHIYVLIPLDFSDTQKYVALEVKVITKIQDILGELTHMLYELQRTNIIESHKKRKIAWIVDSPQFEAAYIGHSAHYLESSIVRLRNSLERVIPDASADKRGNEE